MKENESNFLDKNTVISVLLVFLVWFAWDAYMRKKYPEQREKSPSSPALLAESSEENTFDKKDFSQLKGSTFLKKKERKEVFFPYKGEAFSFSLSSKGMGLKDIQLHPVLNQKRETIWLFSKGQNLPFETHLLLKDGKQVALDFKIEKRSRNSWKGMASWKGVRVQKTIVLDSEEGFLQTKVKLSGDLQDLFGVNTFLTQNPKDKGEQGGWLSFFVQPDLLSFFVFSSQGKEHIPLHEGDEDQVQELESNPPFSLVKVAAIGTKYFGQAWLDQSEVLAELSFAFRQKQWLALIRHEILNPEQDFSLSYQIFIGAKSFYSLKEKHPDLAAWIDFGWFGFLARGILTILHFFFSLMGNWGVAIIILTLLVRFLLLPLVLSSHRSMEVMKKIQPELQKIRKKFKDDPQRMNQEVMACMKTYKANPLGGCLPMLFQIPVFWSLWQSLSNSYSLYRSPFIFWIQDLSSKDPYYVLPVLIGALMFLQQKIAPVSTGSKELTRAMQILPIFMTVFMLQLPSGLTLYVFVSSLFGLIQQIYLNKDQVAISLPMKFLLKK